MQFHYEYAECYDKLVDKINEYYNKEEHFGDDTWYYDAKHEVIDCYVSKYDYEAKEVIDKYGVFKIIREYSDFYGEYDIDESDRKNYMRFYFHLIDRYIMDNYLNELESISKDDSDDEPTE
jgi:hypothetical protein